MAEQIMPDRKPAAYHDDEYTENSLNHRVQMVVFITLFALPPALILGAFIHSLV